MIIFVHALHISISNAVYRNPTYGFVNAVLANISALTSKTKAIECKSPVKW